jgi:hypothetical protein
MLQEEARYDRSGNLNGPAPVTDVSVVVERTHTLSHLPGAVIAPYKNKSFGVEGEGMQAAC